MNEKKEAYKKTKIGWIPEDWAVLRVDQILVNSRLGGNYKNSEEVTDKPLIKMGNISRGKIHLSKVEYILDGETINQDDLLREGDLLFNTRNTLELVGKVAVWENELGKAFYNSNLAKLTFDPRKVCSNYFMNYVFNSHYVLRQLRGIAIGTTSVAAIYSRDLNIVKIALPPFPEQRKIAQILSTWDKAIELTEKLIAAKERRKRGLMQQLLTGKKRFGEFNSEWKEMVLKEFLLPTIREVDKPKRQYLALGIRSHCKGTFLKPNSDPDKNDMEKLYLVKECDLIVNITFAWEGAIAIAKPEDEGALVSHRFPTYTFNSKLVTPKFFNFVVMQRKFRYILRLISPGGAGRNRVLSKKDFLKIRWKLPGLAEQQKIAAVLQAADEEIELLKKKVELLKQQKKGLMQKLLTGKIRVKIDP